MICTTQQAAEILDHGGVVAYPTETVWGFGCDPWNQTAVHKILALKQRPISKGLILLAANIQQIAPLTDPLDPSYISLLTRPHAIATTWLIPDPKQWAPSWIKGEFETVAVRITSDMQSQALCSAFGKPIVSTSANITGNTVVNEYSTVRKLFEHKIDGILKGDTSGNSHASCIKDLITGHVIREP